eukprot:5850066-Pleurochrysis_carterae.AAC.1
MREEGVDRHFSLHAPLTCACVRPRGGSGKTFLPLRQLWLLHISPSHEIIILSLSHIKTESRSLSASIKRDTHILLTIMTALIGVGLFDVLMTKQSAMNGTKNVL